MIIDQQSAREACPKDGCVHMQDTVNIGTKMRNRILHSSIVYSILHMGNETEAIVHIKLLLEKVSNGLIVWSDTELEDRQNYSSFEKLLQPRMFGSLEKNIVNSMGTIMHLKLCQQITSSYLDASLDPVERINRMWNALYFLRG